LKDNCRHVNSHLVMHITHNDDKAFASMEASYLIF
jgi:hypothetical protein